MTCFGINGGQGVETVTNNVYRFVALITSFSAVTVNIIVDAYLFSSDILFNNNIASLSSLNDKFGGLPHNKQVGNVYFIEPEK